MVILNQTNQKPKHDSSKTEVTLDTVMQKQNIQNLRKTELSWFMSENLSLDDKQQMWARRHKNCKPSQAAENLSPLLTKDSSRKQTITQEGNSPWNWPPPEMQLPLKICYAVQVECKSFSGMDQAFTSSSKYRSLRVPLLIKGSKEYRVTELEQAGLDFEIKASPYQLD